MHIPFLNEGVAGDHSPFTVIFTHSMDEVFVDLGLFSITKFTVNMWLGAALLVGAIMLAQKTSMIPKGAFRFLFEELYHFIRDEMVYPTMGKDHGRRLLPFFLTIFSFILTLNLLGMVPIPVIGGAATSNLGFTLSLAAAVLALSIGGGLILNGPMGFVKSFVPSGLPFVLIPVIFALEVFGFFIKHTVLAVRLFANMIAGHMVVGAFIGLIFLFHSIWMAGVSIPLALFISFIELLVAFLQAYVFTLLAVLFVGSTVHPDH